jgi:hypothetical protein
VTDRTERVGRNEALFRSLNERIEDVSRRFLEPTPLSIVCECGNGDCTERIPVATPAYEAVRAESTTFFVVPGHELPDTEDVIDRQGRYLVVRKHPGRPEEIAEETDPRS